MPTVKRERRKRERRLRIPSDDEMRRMKLLSDYGRAMHAARKDGVLALLLPPEFRIRRAAPQSDQEAADALVARVEQIIETRVKARLEAQNIPYTDEMPYRTWTKAKREGTGGNSRKVEADGAARDAQTAAGTGG